MRIITNKSAQSLGLPPSYWTARVTMSYRPLSVDGSDSPPTLKRSLCAACGRGVGGEKHPVGVMIRIEMDANPEMNLTTRGYMHPMCAPLDWGMEMLGQKTPERADTPLSRFYQGRTLRQFIAQQSESRADAGGEGREKDAFDNGIK